MTLNSLIKDYNLYQKKKKEKDYNLLTCPDYG